MKIEKLPSGSYRIRKTYKGKTYTVVVPYKPTQKEAIQLISERFSKVPDKHHMTFSDASDAYIASKANILSPTTIREYKRTNKSLSDAFCGALVSDITQEDVQKEINALAEHLAPKTVRNYHGYISSVLGSVRKDLVLHTTLPQKQKKEPYIPTSNDIVRILEQSKGTMFEVPIMLACMGLRRSEICALTLSDLEGNRLTINKALVQNDRKEWVIKSTKTTESTRTIVIPSKLADLMRSQGFIYKGNPNSITDYLTRLQDKLGMNHFSIHKMRHYFASSLMEQGIDTKTILAMGGWKSDNILKTVYTHLMKETYEEKQQAAADRIGSIF